MRPMILFALGALLTTALTVPATAADQDPTLEIVSVHLPGVALDEAPREWAWAGNVCAKQAAMVLLPGEAADDFTSTSTNLCWSQLGWTVQKANGGNLVFTLTASGGATTCTWPAFGSFTCTGPAPTSSAGDTTSVVVHFDGCTGCWAEATFFM